MASFHDLTMLCPDITGWHIRVKVLRAYTVDVAPTVKSMVVILEDEKGMRIEGGIRNKFVKYYEKFIKEGQWITVMHFLVRPNDDAVKSAMHEYKISFIDHTVVKNADPIAEVFDGNQFTTFQSIIRDQVWPDYLIDVVGAVFYVGHLYNDTGNIHNIDGWRLSFTLEDKDNNILYAMAKGTEALQFNENYKPYRGSPLVVGLRFWKIDREFSGTTNVRICTHGQISMVYPNPNIPEARELHEMLAAKGASTAESTSSC